MNKSIDWYEIAVQIIIEEAKKYIPPEKLAALQLSSDLLVKYSSDTIGETLLEASLENTLMLCEFGFDIDYLISALLYFGYVNGDIPENELNFLGATARYYLQTLLNLGINYEGYLPWIQVHLKAMNMPILEQEKKQFWVDRNREVRPKAFLGMAPTPEIAIIKLVERLHLLKEFEKYSFKATENALISQESLELHATIAEMLGVWALKWQIEDFAFKIINPDMYILITNNLSERRQERQARIDRAIAKISTRLVDGGIYAKVTGRVKHIYGLYKKIQKTGKSVEEINDSLGIRIIVNPSKSSEDKTPQEDQDGYDSVMCFQARDILFDTWEPATGVYNNNELLKDYISKPKKNGYQSLHTTVLFEEKLLEVQIRSQTMHDMAEFGAATHWIYNKAGKAIVLGQKYQHYVDQLTQYRQIFESRNKAFKSKS